MLTAFDISITDVDIRRRKFGRFVVCRVALVPAKVMTNVNPKVHDIFNLFVRKPTESISKLYRLTMASSAKRQCWHLDHLINKKEKQARSCFTPNGNVCVYLMKTHKATD